MPESPSKSTGKGEPFSGLSVRPVWTAALQQETPLGPIPGLGCLSTSSLLQTALRNHIPIFKNNPVDTTSIHDVSAGRRYTLSHGRLNHDVNQEEGKPGDAYFVYRGGLKSRYQKGMPVLLKTISPDVPAPNEGPNLLDCTELCTELTILGKDAKIQEANVVKVIGIGWEPSAPHSSSEQIRYHPYLVTEGGEAGNLDDFFRMTHRNKTKQGRTPIPTTEERFGTWLDSNSPEYLQQPADRPAMEPLSWATKVHIASCIASALATLHHKGVVHGNVKEPMW